jgi:hypothetical protein
MAGLVPRLDSPDTQAFASPTVERIAPGQA